MKLAKSLCGNADASSVARMLALFLGILLGAGWFTPAPARAQTARDWNQAVCHVFGNCSPLHSSLLYYQRSITYRQPHSPAAFGDTGRGVIQMAQRTKDLRFGFAPTHAFSMQSQRSGQSFLSNLSEALASALHSGSRTGPASPLTITNDTFTNGAGTGLWSNPSNWSAGLPGSSNNALITGTGPASSVTEDISATINNLTLSSGNSWTLNNDQSLTIDGNSISNAGSMTIGSTESSTFLEINSPAVKLNGGGTLTMSNLSSNFILGAATADTLTNQETIQGSGNIGDGSMTLMNSGTIDANQSTPLTVQANGGTTNTGTLEATNGATLTLDDTITNTGGSIKATGTNSAVVLNGASVIGGTLTTSSGGTIFGENSALLKR